MNDSSPTPPADDTRPFGTPQANQGPTPEGAAGPASQPAGPAGPQLGSPYAAPYAAPPYSGQPPYAGQPPYPGQPPYSGYPPPPQRPKFSDHVLGMRAVIAVALVALVIGGLGGALLGALAAGNNDDARFGGPGGFPQGGFGPGSDQGQMPHQQFGQNQP